MRSHLNVKASLFTLILAFIAIGTVAIGAVMNSNKAVKEVEETSVTTTTWYFKGGDPESPSSYSTSPEDAPPCTGVPQTICTLEAPANGDEPNFSEIIQGKTVEQHVHDALASLNSSSPLPLNDVVTGYRSN